MGVEVRVVHQAYSKFAPRHQFEKSEREREVRRTRSNENRPCLPPFPSLRRFLQRQLRDLGLRFPLRLDVPSGDEGAEDVFC